MIKLGDVLLGLGAVLASLSTLALVATTFGAMYPGAMGDIAGLTQAATVSAWCLGGSFLLVIAGGLIGLWASRREG